MAIDVARKLGARAIAHGSTGAGNDQVRFDVALQLMASDLEIITPIRSKNFSRSDITAFLRKRDIHVAATTTRYSINAGLWGTTIGGIETLGTREPLPNDAYPGTLRPQDDARDVRISFEAGIPIAVDGEKLNPVPLIETIGNLGQQFGVDRSIHVGDTILGVKGRVAFEAPAPIILVTAHRELEKIVLTKWQRHHKDRLADFYGLLLHEGQHFDPVMRDIEAFLISSQEVVTGEVHVRLSSGNIAVQGCTSPYSMFDTDVATYGEKTAY